MNKPAKIIPLSKLPENTAPVPNVYKRKTIIDEIKAANKNRQGQIKLRAKKIRSKYTLFSFCKI